MTPDAVFWMGVGAIAASVIVAVVGGIGALIAHWTEQFEEDALMDTVGTKKWELRDVEFLP